jgi:acetylornithine deacetylase/succinyl-diaminopimelate desuccinylase-like protein
MNLIELTQQLISIPSYLDDQANEQQLGEFIHDYLQSLGYFQVEKQPVENGRFNVIAHDGYPTRLMFCCHMDTVPPSGIWQHDLFAGHIEGDHLYGLGACDMKGGTASLLYALQAVKATKGLFLLFDVDEEYYFKGMRKFLEIYNVHPELAVFPEPGFKIGNGHRGLIEVKFKVRGATGHAARPNSGKNAILGVSRAVEQLLTSLETYTHPALGKTSCNLAWLKGGIVREDGEIDCRANKIPDMAEAVLDIRPSSAELRAQTVLDILCEQVNAQGMQLEDAEIVLDFGSLYTPPEQLVTFERTVHEILGQATYDDISVGGYGEGQLLNEAFGTPCVYFGPGPEEKAHQVDEHVSIPELHKASAVFKALIKHYTQDDE